MFSFRQKALICAVLICLFAAGRSQAQTAMIDEVVTSQEVSEQDSVPVLIKHLPDWETVKDRAVLAVNAETFARAVNNHPAVAVIIFNAGTEAAVADYDAGKLAIVEFTSPQMATQMDAAIQARIGELNSGGQNVPVYRRVGNYAVFVFGAKDEAAANTLIDQVKYEKVVQWLGQKPNSALQKAERDYVRTTSEVVLNAIQITGYIILFTGVVGGFAGYLIFRSRNRQRLMADTYTDAGGMTRLNLESSPVSTDRLLGSK